MERTESKRVALMALLAVVCAMLLACAFAPQPAQADVDARAEQSLAVKPASRTVQTKAVKKHAKKLKFKVSGAKTSLVVGGLTKAQKKAIEKVKVKGDTVTVTVKKGAKAGTYKLPVHASDSVLYKKSGTVYLKVKVSKSAEAKATNTAARKAYMKKMKKWKASSERDADAICFSYAFMDIDGDGIDEALCIYYPYRYSSGQRFHIADYVGGKVKVLCTYWGYGPQWVKFYRNGRGFVFWSASHAYEWYFYNKLSGGKYKYVAYKMRISEAGGGGMNGPWSYYVGKSETSKAKFNAVVSGIAKGKCKKFSYKKWKSL